MDLTLYQKMIGANKSVTQAYVNDTISHVNDMFSNSPSFNRISLDGVDIDCILSHTKKSTVKELLLRPMTILNKGCYALIGSDTYIVNEFVPNEIYPKANLELCNSDLRWKDQSGNIHSYKCVVKASSFSETDDRQASILQSELVVLVQYNDNTKSVRPSQRFIFGDNAYEVTTIDSVTNVYKGVGVIEFIVKFTSTSVTDDLGGQVADDSGNSGWGEW